MSRMNRSQARDMTNVLREKGYAVTFDVCPLGGYEFRAKDVDGGRDLFAFNPRDIVVLVLGGKVAKL